MTTPDLIRRAVQTAIAEVNEFLHPEQALDTSSTSPLGSRLDSLGMVNLLLATESELAILTGRSVSLTDLLEATGQDSPLATLETFVAFLEARLAQDGA